MNSEVRLRKNIDGLTGLRFFAAFVVLIAHAMGVAFSGAQFKPTYDVDLAYFGMSLFFCLSGFVIYYNYSELLVKSPIIGTYNFAIARFGRLYPLYFFVLVLITGPKFAIYFEPYSYGLLSFITLTQSWIGTQGIHFGPAWSISTECFFYLFFAAVGLRIVHRLNSARALVHLAIFLVAIYGIYWFVVAHAGAVQKLVEVALPEQYKKTAWGWLLFPSPYMRILEFIAGMLAAKLYLSPQMSRIERYLPLASALSVIAIGLCMYFFANLQVQNWMRTHTVSNVLLHMRGNAFYTPLIVIILLGVSSHQSHLVKSVCTNQLVLRLGEMSYSIYLMQHFAFAFNHAPTSVDYWAQNNIGRIVFSMVVSIVATFIISFGTYHLIEVPGRRAIRRALSYESISDAVARLTSRYRPKRRTDESDA